jgi:outer membrane protein TolC
LQTSVINQLAQSKAMVATAKSAFEQAQSYAQSVQARTKKSQRQFDAGQIDRLELASTQLENITATQNVLTTANQLALATTAIEDVTQRPIDATPDITSIIEDKSFNRKTLDTQ